MNKFAILCVLLLSACAEDVTGTSGNLCYNNETCDQPNTCFRIKDEKLCYLEVKPVVLGTAKMCYTFSTGDAIPTEQTKCFDNFDECLTSFAETLNKPGTVVRGCAAQ